jgi:hypothetical protein
MTPVEARAQHRRFIRQIGETVTLRRYSGTGDGRTKRDWTVQARVTGYGPQELVGTIQQGDRKLIVLADDVAACGWRPQLRKGDKVVVRGQELNIEAVDDNTRRIGGELIAYELQARG